jgi:hypothetical protein
MVYPLLLTAFMVGFLSKFVDLEEHGMKVRKLIIYFTGICYGLLIAYAVKLDPSVVPLAFATILGVIITGKIDSNGHLFGIASFVLFMLAWGVPPTNLIYLGILFVAALAEEYVNTWILDKKMIKNFVVEKFLEVRPIMEFVTLGLAAITGAWALWYTLFFFDLGYNLVNRSFIRFAKKELA